MKKNLLGVSALTLGGLYILLSIIVLGFCLALDLNMLIGIIVCIVIIVLQFIISPFLTDLTVKWFYKCDFNAEIPQYLQDFIKKVCEKHKMKYPRIGVINDGSPNAFTYGHTKNNARVVLTRGDFELLSEEEVKAVVAHELGHASHYDMLFMTAASLVPLFLYMIFEMLIDSTKDSSNDDNGYTGVIAVIAYVLYVISNYVVLWLSRTREYYADEFSCKETENPNALASALVKVGFGLLVNSDVENKAKALADAKDDKERKKIAKEYKHNSSSNIGALGLFDKKTSKSLVVMTNNKQDDKLVIKNAMKWEMWNPWALWYQLNSTHPLISKRLLFISEFSESYGQKPYITFDLQKPESYADDFAKEVVLKLLPPLTAVITLGVIIGIGTEGDSWLLALGIGMLFFTIFNFILFKVGHKSDYKDKTVSDLLSEVKVSGVTCVPCILKGKIIGRGDPGYMFNEDFMIKDETGIIYADYNTPSFIINKIFAIFKNGNNMEKEVIIKGWYKRKPVPYVEIFNFQIEGEEKVHKTGLFTFNIVLHILLLILSIVLMICGVV